VDSLQVIVCDIDGTVVDVTGRIEACLREIGVAPVPDAQVAANALKGKDRSRFFDVFLSEKYTRLDTPVPEIVAAVRDLQAVSGLPVVFLSGRPESMKKSTRQVLNETGLAYNALILRPISQRMRKTTDFKVDAVKRRAYDPKHVLDDDAEILAAFAVAFPSATLYRISGSQATPWPD
jgi:hypothetical protein